MAEIAAFFQVLNPVFLEAVSRPQRVFGLDIHTLRDIGIILFNVILLAATLSFILYRPVREIMRKRTERIEGQLRDAAESLENANNMKAEYEKKLVDIETERASILAAAHKQADENGKRLIDEAKLEANAVVERAVKQAQSEKERVKNEIRQQIIEVSALMAGKFMTKEIDQASQNNLFDSALRELESAKWPS